MTTNSKAVTKCQSAKIAAGWKRLNLMISPRAYRALIRQMRKRELSGNKLVDTLLIEADK